MVKPVVLVQRILFGALAIALLVALFELDLAVAQRAQGRDGLFGELLRRGSLIPLVFTFLIVIAVKEFHRLLRALGARPFSCITYPMSVVLLLLPWFSAAGVLGTYPADLEGTYWSLVGVLGVILGTGINCLLRGDPAGTIRDASATVWVVLYLGFLGSFGLQLRCGVDAPQQQGVWLLLIAILVTKCSDIGAYFAGSAFGRHKLIPSISPGKTVEGAVGGLLGSGLAALAFATLGCGVTASAQTNQGPWLLTEITRSFGFALGGGGYLLETNALLFGFSLSIAAQIGDLIESCFKREAGTKDSGSIMPHYGGVLDLVDSPLFALPLAWFLLTRVWTIP